jgi:hypothetical protein
MTIWLLVLEERGLALGTVHGFRTEAGAFAAAATEIRNRLDAGEWPATTRWEAKIRELLAAEDLAEALSLWNEVGADGQRITLLDVEVKP